MLGRNYTEIIIKNGRAPHKSGLFSPAFNFPAVRFIFFSSPLKPIETPATEHSVAAVKQYLICITAEEILDCSTEEALQIVWSCLLHILLSFSRSFTVQETEDPSVLQISAFATILQTNCIDQVSDVCFPPQLSYRILLRCTAHFKTCQMKRFFENTEQEITKPSISKAGVLSPIDPENSAEHKSKKPAAKHYPAKATMEFNRNLVQDGEKKQKKSLI